jgi:hypothetical protein
MWEILGMTKMDLNQLKEELKKTRIAFDSAGGRGVELAEKIDELRQRIQLKELSSTFYQWKTPIREEDGSERLITPRSDPQQHEHPFDLIFDTPEQAEQSLKDWDVKEEACEEGWVMVRTSETAVYQLNADFFIGLKQ